jgi:eukaryotic-like serine/threonine-protein kinase
MIGKRISHYKITEQIGAGGMGVVYRAHDEELQRSVALKVLPPGMLAEESARRRFRKEALALAKLNHPNIATVHEFGSEQDLDFLVTEYIAGETLDQKLANGALQEKEVIRLGNQLAQGLDAAHAEGIVHRDLKPGNLRITPDGRLKILDFGLAQLLPKAGEADAAATLTQTQSLVGTLPYMPPEQLRGEENDARSDIWAAGAVLYEMATGRRAFPETNGPLLISAILNHDPQEPSKLNRKISPGLEMIVMKALAKDPAHRYQSAKEVGVDLERLTAGMTPLAKPPRDPARMWLIAGGIAAALLLAAGAYFYTHRTLGTKPIGGVNGGAAAKTRRSVAVLGFKNLAGRPEMAWMSTALSEMLTTELAAGEQLRMIPGESVAQMKLSVAPPETESYGKDTLARIRTILGTDEVVMGTYVPVGDGEIRLDVRLQDTTAGETLASVSAKGTEDHLDELISQAGAELRQKLGIAEVSTSESAQVKATMPANREAARLYAEGLAKLRVYDNLGARALLQKALDLEPNFALSHGALGAAWSNLGYDAKAKAEVKKAFELSEGMSREDRLQLEAKYRESALEGDKAIELYQTLFNFFPDNLEYGLQLANAERSFGRVEESAETIGELRKLPAPVKDDPRIDLADATTSRARGDFKGVLSAAERAAEKAQADGSQLIVARALSLQCMAQRNLGDVPKAIELCAKAKDIFAATGDLNGVATTLNNLGNCYYDQGNLAGAKETYEGTLTIYRKIGNQSGMAGAMDNIANVLGDMGKPEEAKKLSQGALQIYREIGDYTGEGETLNNIAAAYVTEGNLADAALTFEESLKIWKLKGDTNGMATALTNLAEMLLDQGKLAESKSKYEEALAIFKETGQKGKTSYQLIGLGQVLYAQGELTSAREKFEEVVVMSRENQDKHELSTALAGLGEVLLSEGDLKGARVKYEESLKIRKEIGEKGTAAESSVGLAQVALEEKRAAEAEKLARAALEEFRKEKLRDDEISARGVLADALLAQGKMGDAGREIEAGAALAAKTSMVAVRLEFAIARARVLAATGNMDGAVKSLRTSQVEAEKYGYGGNSYAIQFALAELEMKSGKSEVGRTRMKGLAKDARAKGFVLIGDKAARALGSEA